MKRRMLTIGLVFLFPFAVVCGGEKTEEISVPQKVVPIKGFPDASLTIFPLTVFWTGYQDMKPEHRAWADAFNSGFRQNARSFAEMLGLLLEEKGYDKCQIADVIFELPDGNPTRQERTAAFAKFVSEQDLKTDYALNTEMTLFTDKSGMYVYSIIVDATGNLAWADDREYRGKLEFDCL